MAGTEGLTLVIKHSMVYFLMTEIGARHIMLDKVIHKQVLDAE